MLGMRPCHSERSEESRVYDCLSAQVYPRGILRFGVLPASLDCQDASAAVAHCLGFFVVSLLRMTNAVPVCTGMTSHRRSREDGSPSAATPGFLPSHQVRGRLRRNDVWGAFVRAWLRNTVGAVREPPLHYVNPLAGGPVSRLDRLCRRACTTTPLDDEHRRTYACHHQQEHEEQPHREPAALVRRRRRRGLWP